MKEINEENMDVAIALGDAVCSELDICCRERGQVIFQIYRKLNEMNSKKGNPVTPNPGASASNSPSTQVKP